MPQHLWRPRTQDHRLTGGIDIHIYIYLRSIHEYLSIWFSLYLHVHIPVTPKDGAI